MKKYIKYICLFIFNGTALCLVDTSSFSIMTQKVLYFTSGCLMICLLDIFQNYDRQIKLYNRRLEEKLEELKEIRENYNTPYAAGK